MLLAVLTLPDWFAGERPDKATPRSPRLGVGGCYYSIAKKRKYENLQLPVKGEMQARQRDV